MADLGNSPPSNAYRSMSDLQMPEIYYPLKVYICEKCLLAQTIDYTKADELFANDYAYFSSTSSSWLLHAAQFAKNIINKLKLTEQSLVVEVASNDGYLLKNFVAAKIPCLGIEPTEDTAKAAEAIGIPVVKDFFGAKLAKEIAKNGKADLICGNNVFAHVPDINDFTSGLQILLKKDGVITLEFPHLFRLISEKQFDTIYHEHFSYLSLNSVNSILSSNDLRLFDVEELPTHGGSLRIYACHFDDIRATLPSVTSMLNMELEVGMGSVDFYTAFQANINNIKNDFLSFLISEKKLGKRIAAYGAAAKGNTLLNYCGIKTDLIEYVCDAANSKQGKLLPGSHIPIVPPNTLRTSRPDLVIVFPWNLIEEVIEQNHFIRSWGGKFVTAIPSIKVY